MIGKNFLNFVVLKYEPGAPPGPSNTQIEPEMDLVRLILGDPCQKKAHNGPFKVGLNQFS